MSPLAPFVCIILLAGEIVGYKNLSCYQCVRFGNQECDEGELVPCSVTFDRCVTHIAKDEKRGYMIKRECGLGPCAFEDDMVNRGLGISSCDRSKEEFFCVSCCRTTGCNKSLANTNTQHTSAILATVATLYFVFH